MVEKKEREFGDHIGFKTDTEILASLDKQKNGKWPNLYLSPCVEKIIFSCRVIKYNRFGMKQERHLLLTTLYLSNLKKKSIHLSINCL